MATYYVRTDGNNSNAGTGSGTGDAWATVAHALGGTGTASGVTGGDTIYIAPGKYAGLTIAVAPSSTLSVIGDPSGAQFGYTIPPGPVHISNAADRALSNVSVGIAATSKNNITLKYLVVGGLSMTTCHNLIIDGCHFYPHAGNVNTATLTFTAGVDANTQILNSSLVVGQFNTTPLSVTFSNDTSSYVSSFKMYNVAFNNNKSITDVSIVCNNATGIVLSNIFSNRGIIVTGTVANQAKIINSILQYLTGSIGGNLTEDYNLFQYGFSASRTNVSAGVNSFVANSPLIYGDTMAQTGAGAFSSVQPAPTVFNQLIGYGTTTDAPTTDYFGNAYGTPMTIGIAKSATLTGAGVYSASERNVSSTAIIGGSISQSIELYLGVTGLTATTNGLRAFYNRTRTLSVNIPLVARTITQPWISGGFAEVDPVGMPGVYRLDLPDEAIATGADDCTVVVRGASGTNGSVMTIDLRNYTFISTTGYKLISDQLGANGILDVLKGSSITVKLQMVDVNNKPVPIGTAACTVEVYSLNNLVESYPTVIQYQSNGELTFTLDTTVTNTPGTYNIYVVRNNGGSDTVLYGPMKLVVSNL